MIKRTKKNLRYLVPLFLFIAIFTTSCNKTDAEKQSANIAPTAIPTPEESPESFQNDIEDYEPTDSLSQDSDGPVH